MTVPGRITTDLAIRIQEVWGEEPGADIEIHLIHPGGQSGDPSSPHCTDRAERYITGDLRTVYFSTSGRISSSSVRN
ncbi:MAG: penicillin acylase family protein [Acidobacteriaceae bacterium]